MNAGIVTDKNQGSQTMNRLLPLAIDKLVFSTGQEQLLCNIEAQITDNGISVIMGHNGAGKSVLLRCLNGLLPPTSGSITWGGKDASLIAIRQQQTMVFQKPLLLNRSVAANIRYVLKLRGKPVSLSAHFLESAGLADKHAQPARALSGGEQQRLAMARAMATEPSVLLLDEPTANLDPVATQLIEATVLSAKQQSIKVIMVTHDVAQAKRLADEVLFLDGGTLTEHSASEQFFTQPASNAAREYLAAYLS